MEELDPNNVQAGLVHRSRFKLFGTQRLIPLLLAFMLSACSMMQQTSIVTSTIPAQIAAPTESSTPTTTPLTEPTPHTASSDTFDTLSLSDKEIPSQVDELAIKFLHDTRNTGLSVAVVLRDPATGSLKAGIFNYGATSEQNGHPITSATIYEIGSLTKLFTGILLAQAVLAGKVKLDDSIQQYLPPSIHAPIYKGIPITLVELATHRSGLPRNPSNKHGIDPFSEAYTEQNLNAWVNGYQLTRAPSVEYEYSNAGFALLGNILSGIAREDYGELELQTISQPLGLKDTEIVLSSEQEDRLAQGYAEPGVVAPYFPQSGGMKGAGYLRSTISDMTRFLIANMQPDSTSLAAGLKLAQAYQVEADGIGKGMGLGWQISDAGQGKEWLWKRGETNGFTSYIALARDDRWGFALLTNGPAIESLAPDFLQLLGGLTE